MYRREWLRLTEGDVVRSIVGYHRILRRGPHGGWIAALLPQGHENVLTEPQCYELVSRTDPQIPPPPPPEPGQDAVEYSKGVLTSPEELNMADKATTTPALRTVLESDAKEAAFRLAGSQFIKACREPLVAGLSRQLGEDSPALRGKIAAFLDSDIGEALLAGLLSLGLSMIPAATGEIPAKLARELRVRAMGEAGDVVADLLMGPLRTVVAVYLKGVPTDDDAQDDAHALPAEREAETVRVPETVENRAVTTLDAATFRR